MEGKKQDGCKGCSANVHVSEEQIERILSKLAMHPDEVVSEKHYAERLKACESCSSLQYGTTCAHCGCFVRIRAKMTAKSCPNPKGSIWV